jgi:hypothetical protein
LHVKRLRGERGGPRLQQGGESLEDFHGSLGKMTDSDARKSMVRAAAPFFAPNPRLL